MLNEVEWNKRNKRNSNYHFQVPGVLFTAFTMHETLLWYEKCPLHLCCDYFQPYIVVVGTSVTVSQNPRKRLD